jgi:hypothetical protein
MRFPERNHAMLTHTKRRRRPTHLLRFTGFLVAPFDSVCAVLAPRVEQARRERLSRPNRQRAIGGGGQYALSLPDRLLLSLRLYVPQACRVDARTRRAKEVVEQLREHFGKVVFATVIRENVRLAECPSFSRPITQYDARSAGAQDYLVLAKEVMRQERSHR